MRIGFIGTGNMGTAILKGYVAACPEEAENVSAYDVDGDRLLTLARENGIRACVSPEELAEAADVVLLAVKPAQVEAILGGLAERFGPAFVRGEKTLISIAAGVSLQALQEPFGGKASVIRAMPNTPALVGEGMSALCRSQAAPDRVFHWTLELFSSIGRVESVEEKLMDAVTGLSGSGPAYVYVFIEALADGAVAWGLPREQACTMAAQTVLGAAKMVLETGLHPGLLKDRVCSPGGTTIRGVKALEDRGFRSAAMAAVEEAAKKSEEMRR
ncbi:MAG: pyrroline-5-carboxylate reductase [Bacillota bacterium]|nr:pyrroline-5-carboxylate reductase [Bacillota bacterium]